MLFIFLVLSIVLFTPIMVFGEGGVPNQPMITSINPSHQVSDVDNFYCNSHNPVITWNQTQQPGQPFNANKVTTGYYHTLAVKNDGSLWSWGNNYDGQLGNGFSSNTSNPIQVKNSDGISFTNISAIASGGYHTVLLKNDGTLWTSGYNGWGELGIGTITSNSYPIQVKNSDDTSFLNVKAIAAGAYHSLALKSDGTVWAWGNNLDGQLGNGTTTSRSNPIQVTNSDGTLFSNVKTIATGGYHSLALKCDGTVWAWGDNLDGQLGNGTSTSSSYPIQVKNSDGTWLSNVTAIAAGGFHTLALKNDGTLWAWGYNEDGELGNGTNLNSNYPIQVKNFNGASFINVIAIAAGKYHTLALKSDNTVWAWGYNEDGELGNGTTSNSRFPTQAKNSDGTFFTNVSALLAGYYHSMALKKDGTLWTWGYNEYGQLGNGTTYRSKYPIQVKNSDGTSFINATIISAGGYHSLTLKNNGTLWAWGDNFDGQLGNGTTTDYSKPIQVKNSDGTSFSNVFAVTGGIYHSLAIKTNGTLWAWGDNLDGQLGIGTFTNVSSPTQVKNSDGSFFVNVLAVSGGGYHTLALKNDNVLWAWGCNSDGQLGNGTNTDNSYPIQVKNSNNSSFTNVIAIAAGCYHSLALKSDGTVWAWGDNQNGQLGNGTNSKSKYPIQVKNSDGAVLSNIQTIAAGEYHSLALKNDGTLWAWGDNLDGQLGNGTTRSSNYPTQVINPNGSPFNNIAAIAAGGFHTLALKNDGTLWTWGYNERGELGNGTTISSSYPIQVKNFDNTPFTNGQAIATGEYYSLILKSDGTLWALGDNGDGQFGNDTYYSQLFITPVMRPSALICFTKEHNSSDNYTFIYDSSNSTSLHGINDGDYQAYIQTINDYGASLWSEGVAVTIDTVSPLISEITGRISGSNVKLIFTSSEPVNATVYWDLSTTPLSLTTDYKTYNGTDATALDLGNICSEPTRVHYYRIEFKDKAQNFYSTGIVQVGGSVTLPPPDRINSITAEAKINNGSVIHQVTVAAEPVIDATLYKFYRRKNGGSAECLTPSGTANYRFIDTNLPAHDGFYEYGYATYHSSGTESLIIWGNSQTNVSPKQNGKVYIPNLPPQPIVNGLHSIVVFTDVSVQLGKAKDLENDQLTYKLFIREKGTDTWTCHSMVPTQDGQSILLTLTDLHNYEWYLTCIETDPNIIDKGEIIVIPTSSLYIDIHYPLPLCTNAFTTDDYDHMWGTLGQELQFRVECNPLAHFQTFSWNFGDGTPIQSGQQTTHTYYQLSDPAHPFDIVVTATDDQGNQYYGYAKIRIINTPKGRLYTDETWSGTQTIDGEVIVPTGINLTIQPGTQLTVNPSADPDHPSALIIEGNLNINGTESQKVSFSGNGTLWEGILIEGTANIQWLAVSDAERGVAGNQTANVVLTHCTFDGNLAGVHAHGGSPTITNCIFNNNSYYGIKKDAQASPVVTGCQYNNNGMDYYDETDTGETKNEKI